MGERFCRVGNTPLAVLWLEVCAWVALSGYLNAGERDRLEGFICRTKRLAPSALSIRSKLYNAHAIPELMLFLT